MLQNLKRRTPEPKAIETSLSRRTVVELEQFRKAEGGKKWARDAKGMEVLAAYLGKTQGMLNRSGLWEQIQLNDGEIWATVPLFAAMIRSIQKEAARSKPLYSLRGDFADVDEQEVARYGTAIIEYLSKRFWTPEEEQEDVLSSIAFGFGQYEVTWDDEAGEAQALVTMTCAACGTTGHSHKADVGKGEVRCPTLVDGMECGTVMQAAAEFEIPAGDVVLRRIDPFSFNSNTWATKGRPAVWWSIDEIVDRAVWDDLHPEIDLPRNAIGTSLGENLLHLRRQRSVQRAQMGLESTAAMSRGRSELTSERDVVRQRDFFAPAVYERWKTGTPETLPSGRTIPGNTAVRELFPDGMCVLRDGSGRVLDLYEAEPSRSLHTYNFATKPGDRWGASIAAQALECQYALEEDLSQLQTVASEMGNPTMFYKEGLFDGRLGTHPSGKHPVKSWLTDQGLDDLIKYAPAASPSPVVFQLVLFYEQRMQGVLGSAAGSGGGLPDAVGPTATANMNARSEAEGQQGQYLELRAAAKQEVLQEGVRLFAKHADIRRAISMGGPFADGAVLQLDKSMLPERFALEVKKDSWWPRDRGQQQQAEMLRHQMLGAANQTSMMVRGEPLDVLEERYINDLCGSEIGANLTQIGAELAVREWRKAKGFIGRVLGGQPTPSDLQFVDQARQQMIAEAMAEIEQAAMMSTIESLGAGPMGAPGGMPPPMAEPGMMPGAEMMGADPAMDPTADGAVGPMGDPMASGMPAGPMGQMMPAASMPPMAPAPMQVPEPPLEEVVLAAAELAVPIRPGLTPAAKSIAGQLRYEALKPAARELPDVYLEWLDRRAQSYDALARERKAMEMGAAGGPGALGAPGGPEMNGTGSPIGDALQTRLAAIQSGTADSLGLPSGPSPAPAQPAAVEERYG